MKINSLIISPLRVHLESNSDEKKITFSYILLIQNRLEDKIELKKKQLGLFIHFISKAQTFIQFMLDLGLPLFQMITSYFLLKAVTPTTAIWESHNYQGN